MLKQWEFPHGRKLTPRGVNDPAINSFLDNVIDSLTREVIQNSLDAKDMEVDSPVIITFNFKKIETESIPGINQIITDALPRAKEFWKKKNNQGTLDYLNNFENTIKMKTVNVMKISDHNTIGLDEKSYDALVLGNGYTEKINENSAGSKGIGKAAPFAISDLRLVFYNTVPKKNSPKHVGVLNFVSFNCNDDKDDITQERALYQEKGLDYIRNQIDFGFKERKLCDFGTDIFILGFREIEEKWENKILLSAVNNFLVSILDKKLVIEVNDKKLDHTTIQEIISLLSEEKKSHDERKLFNDTLNFYEALTSNDSLEFKLDEKFLEYPFINDISDGKLILLETDMGNRSILQTRISGMKISNRNGISGNIKFTGVFRATGIDFDRFLKGLENTNHTNWSEDQASKEDRMIAKKLLKDLFQWYKERVKTSFEIEVDESVDAFGLSDFLPQIVNDEGTIEKSPESGIKNKIKKFEIKRTNEKNKFNQSSKDEEGRLNSILENLGYGDENPGNGGKKNSSTGGGIKGKIKPYLGGLKNLGLFKKERINSAEDQFIMKSIVTNRKLGQYRVILKPIKDMEKIDLKLYYIGEDGSSTAAEVLNVSSTTNKINVNQDSIRIEKILKNQQINIDVTIDKNVLVKMEGKIYEVKS
ncbi:hypothetical protein BOVMAS37_09580 [Streptococcus uberis]